MLTTTLRHLRKYRACKDGYAHLVQALGPGWEDDQLIPLLQILEHNGLSDCLWALRAVPPAQQAERDRLARLFACRCVRETPLGDGRTVWDLLSDERSRQAVEVAEIYARGEATAGMLAAVEAAAEDAAWDAARDAAWEAARAAEEAALDAVRAAARGISWAAAWDAVRAAQTTILREMLGVPRC